MKLFAIPVLLAVWAVPETVAIGENCAASGTVSSAAQFSTEGIITCRVGLFLSGPKDGRRSYHFAHSPELPIDTPAFHAFLRTLGGGFTALVFAPASLIQSQAGRLQAYFGPLDAHLVLVPYGDTDVYEGFKFLAELDGRTLTVRAGDGRRTIVRRVRLGE